jgi:hypothetical protein
VVVLAVRWRRLGLRASGRWAGGVGVVAGPASTVFTAGGVSQVFRLAFSGVYGLRRHRRPGGPDADVVRVAVSPRFERHIYRPALTASHRLARRVSALADGSPLSYVGYVLAPLLAGLVVLATWR